MRAAIIPFAVAMACLAGGAARAGELFGGVYAHDVNTPLTRGFEGGASVQLGWRGDRIEALGGIGSPSPYLFGSASLSGGTNFGAAGLSWKIGDTFYVRPGIGIAIHDRSSHAVDGPFRSDFGSRILFEPEIGVGYRFDERLSAELSWTHLSHAKLFGDQNPGMDTIGVRLNYRFR